MALTSLKSLPHQFCSKYKINIPLPFTRLFNFYPCLNHAVMTSLKYSFPFCFLRQIFPEAFPNWDVSFIPSVVNCMYPLLGIICAVHGGPSLTQLLCPVSHGFCLYCVSLACQYYVLWSYLHT